MSTDKPRLVGLNHIALEVGDIEKALHFYGSIFSFDLRGSHKDDAGRVVIAFIDLGDQFIALSRGRHQRPDRIGISDLSSMIGMLCATSRSKRAPKCWMEIFSTSSIPGVTGSKLSNTAQHRPSPAQVRKGAQRAP